MIHTILPAFKELYRAADAAEARAVLGLSSSGTIPILAADPVLPVLGEYWITEYNSDEAEVVGLGLLFTYTEPVTLEALLKVKVTNQVVTING